MSVTDYILKLTKLSKYSPTIMEDTRAEINKFVIRIYELVVNKCRSSMLIPTLNISLHTVHSKKIEKQKHKQVGRELKKTKADDGNSSKARFEVQDKPRFSNQVPPSTPRVK